MGDRKFWNHHNEWKSICDYSTSLLMCPLYSTHFLTQATFHIKPTQWNARAYRFSIKRLARGKHIQQTHMDRTATKYTVYLIRICLCYRRCCAICTTKFLCISLATTFHQRTNTKTSVACLFLGMRNEPRLPSYTFRFSLILPRHEGHTLASHSVLS